MTIELMKQWLEALVGAPPSGVWTDKLVERHEKAITSLRQAIAEAEKQAPVAWLHWLHGPVRVFVNKDIAMAELDRLNQEYPVDKDDRQMLPLYTHPQPKREWVGLTDELIEYGKTASEMMARDQTRFDAACEVLRYLKQERVPYYYLHRMLTVIHGNEEAKLKEKNT